MTEEDKLHRFSVLVRQGGSSLKPDFISCHGLFAQRRWEFLNMPQGQAAGWKHHCLPVREDLELQQSQVLWQSNGSGGSTWHNFGVNSAFF